MEGRLIVMVASAREPSHNNSSWYPTIGRSQASGARTSDEGMIRNLNPDFNVIWLQTIMESIQWMAPKGSPLVALAQQGAKAANYVIAQWSANNPWGEHSVGNWSKDRAKIARSEAASSISGNRRLGDNDACQQITQNHQFRGCGHGRDCRSGLRHFPLNYYKSSPRRFIDGGIKTQRYSKMDTVVYVVRAVGA
jgi:hypothetical protein